MPGVLIVIASSVDHKVMNRVLLHLRDWEYSEEPMWDNFLLITSKILPETDDRCWTRPPISENELSNNVWTGQSIADVESFMLNEGKKKDGWNLNTFLILDDRPWEKAYMMWCNLDIANMDFNEFVEEDDGDEVEWWIYKDFDDGHESEEAKSIKEKRDNVIAELEQKGMA